MLLISGARWMSLAVLVFCSQIALAERVPPGPDSHAIVAGFERFFTGDAADAVRGGQLLLGELNCTSCHAGQASFEGRSTLRGRVFPKQAPLLDDVGSRVRPEALPTLIAHPQRAKPGSTMPNLFAGLSDKEKASRVDALVHFLASTGALHETMPDKKAAGRGKELFGEVGCVACHGPRTPDAEQLAWRVPLGDPAGKYSVESLARFLRDPLAVRPSGRMPSLNLKEEEAHQIANYFFKDVHVPPNLTYQYFEGSWQRLPDFAELAPKATGQTAGFDLGVARRTSNIGLRFEGFLTILQGGEYTFHLGSDDGSRLAIDGRQVVLNDGLHAFAWKSGKTRLDAGVHPIFVEFFQGSGPSQLRLECEGPGTPRRNVASLISLTPKGRTPEESAFRVDPDLAARGRKLFGTLGCAACHQLKQDGRAIKAKTIAKPLATLKPHRGCLADDPVAPLPRYQLSSRERDALIRALAAMKNSTGKPSAPAETVSAGMTAWNCYACHSRGKIGGVPQAWNKHFQTTIPEMGDEGRIPPRLDGVGDKLTADWLGALLAHGAKDRPYMLTRMPKFGRANVGHLVELFQTLDEQPAIKRPEFDEPAYRVKAVGRHIVGGEALSCFKCHNFGKHPATGIGAADLTTMTRRLRESWFYRYMINPQQFRPGTRMPAAWPYGKSVLPKIYDGDTQKQLAAVWMYLSDGTRAGVPRGLIPDPIELVPEQDPIIYRNFIEGLSPRGIAVGYPEKAHLAFDAEKMSPALIWHGAFLDASKHWTGRGAGYQRPLGDHVLKLVDGVPFAHLEDRMSPWPNEPARQLGYRFGGYRLDKDRRPTFLYRFHALEIEDFPRPIRREHGQDASFLRTLTMKTPDGAHPSCWFRAAAGGKIEAEEGGWYHIDDAVKMHLRSSVSSQPVIRKMKDRWELLVPVRFHNHRAQIVQEIRW